MEFEYIHTHPGGGMPPIKAKDLTGDIPIVYATESDNLQISADTEQQGEETSYTVVKEVKVYLPGKIRVKFAGKKESAGGSGYAKVVVNSADYTERELTTSYVEYSEDVDVMIGDIIYIKAYTSTAAVDYFIKNFRIYFDMGNSQNYYEIITN